MEKNKAVIIFYIVQRRETYDLEVPLDITANDLINALNTAYNLNIDMSDVKNCFLKAENPIALLRGNKTLDTFGIRNGSVIYYSE